MVDEYEIDDSYEMDDSYEIADSYEMDDAFLFCDKNLVEFYYILVDKQIDLL
jgi:hypothetical protein